MKKDAKCRVDIVHSVFSPSPQCFYNLQLHQFPGDLPLDCSTALPHCVSLGQEDRQGELQRVLEPGQIVKRIRRWL